MEQKIDSDSACFYENGFSINSCHLSEGQKSYSLALSHPEKFQTLEFLKDRNDVVSIVFLSLEKLSKTDLLVLAEMPCLEELSFWNCEDLDDERLFSILECNFLKKLNLGNCKKISDRCLRKIDRLSFLESLNLAGCSKVSDEAVQSICRLKNLLSLNLSFSSVSDIGVDLLVQNSRLQSLSLNYCPAISNAGIKSLSKLSNLERISLNGCERLDFESLKILQESCQLKELNIGGTLLRDADLKHLPKQIISLGLGWMKHLTDDGILEIIKLEKLEKLILNRCVNITEKGIRLLSKCKNLKVLDVRNCQNPFN